MRCYEIKVVLYPCQIICTRVKLVDNIIIIKNMALIYEIHKYQHDDFQYVVASTNKYSEIKVKNDVERMNTMLNESLKTLGIRYVFIISDTANSSYKERKRNSC